LLHVYGEDFARSGHLSVIAPMMISEHLVRWVPFLVELRNVPTRQQEQILWHIIDRLPRFQAAAMDATGNGETIAEYTLDKYGQRIEPVMPMEPIVLGPEDVFCHISAGGAGYGDALQRDPARVLADVIEERFTADYARAVYGVVIDLEALEIDKTATEALRADMIAPRANGPDARPAYLRLFHEPLGISDFALEGERTLRLPPAGRR